MSAHRGAVPFGRGLTALTMRKRNGINNANKNKNLNEYYD